MRHAQSELYAPKKHDRVMVFEAAQDIELGSDARQRGSIFNIEDRKCTRGRLQQEDSGVWDATKTHNWNY